MSLNQRSQAIRRGSVVHDIRLRALVIVSLFALELLPLSAATPTAAQNERGLYVYSGEIAIRNSPASTAASGLIQALSVPGIDGITLVENWSSIEPALGVYEWDPGQTDLLDQWISAAISSGKKINLAIRAGQDTPCWLFQPGSKPGCPAGYTQPYAGATALPTFQVSAHQGIAGAPCQAVTIAAPWDPIFLSQWDSMLAAVAQHLQQQGTYRAITQVRLTGINRTTDEFRLPEENLTTPCTANSIEPWVQAGYRPARLLQAWDAITTSFQKSFPEKSFNVAIIPTDLAQGQYPFPEIDDVGCVYSPPVPSNDFTSCVDASGVPDQNWPLLELAARKFPGHLVVEFENLDIAQPADAEVIKAAETLGTGAGFMTNNYHAAHGGLPGAACSGGYLNPVSCDSTQYLALLEIGIYPLGRTNSLRSQFIEVFFPDVTTPGLQDDIWRAHVELIDYTPPVTTATISGTTGRSPIVVSLTATDDLSGVATTEFSWNNGLTWTNGNVAFVTSAGTTNILFRSTDVAGNVEAPSSITVLIAPNPNPNPHPCGTTCI